MISGCCSMEFIRHTHLILECNSSLILICFLIICNIISQKPPFLNSFSQKKVQLLRVGIRFLCPSNFYSLKIKLYQGFQKVRRKLSVVPVVGLEPTRPWRQQILSLPRLPIPTHRHIYCFSIITNLNIKIKYFCFINLFCGLIFWFNQPTKLLFFSPY